ncbi:MAG: biotin carboxylase N-terminal domain-containing protein, partial [Verrucomicrobiota bacterium]
MFEKVLIANRGAIACRIQRTLRRLGVSSVAIFSEPDRASRHRLEADEAVALVGATAADTYLDIDAIIEAARATGAEAIHPGYGFLSEKAEFAAACEEAGLVFLGPTPAQLETSGLKHVCREIARAHEVPLLEGTPVLENARAARIAAEEIGFPVMVKSSAGGGGIGMQIARAPEEVEGLFERVERLSEANFGDRSVFLERYIERARHIEVQCFGDGKGTVVALGDRDCSAQRRNQKIIEECPAPGLSDEERGALVTASIRMLGSMNYRSAGTVEFLWDDIAREFYFLEVNARLQVEHGVTEEVFGIDLIEWMLEVGADELSDLTARREGLSPNGHALEARLYAEDPHRDFRPSTGLVTAFDASPSLRVESSIQTGDEVSAYYDPMVAKLIAHGPDRETAIARLASGLAETRCHGLETNRRYLISLLADERFRAAEVSTRLTDSLVYQPRSFEILDPGLETTVQDYPGRVGFWNVGVPPSGPFDTQSFRLGNRIVGNPESASGLEMLVRGINVRFDAAATICITGATIPVALNGIPVKCWVPLSVSAGSVLMIGDIDGPGQRAYLLISGGLDVPEYLGSRSTFRLGKFGGHGGRALQTGDVIHFGESASEPKPLLPEEIPQWSNEWTLRVNYGPHGAPDFFTEPDIERFFSARWEVHYNSDRTGVRLIGPKPEWARSDGGEAGLHPSNIHDNAY